MKRLDGAPRADKGVLRKYANVEETDIARKEQRRAACERYRNRNKDKLRQRSKEYRERNKFICIARTRAWQAKNAEREKNNILLRKYGMTLREYDLLVEEQKGKCPICNKKKKLVVDHCHVNGFVRALLCDSCNRGLGFFYDDPAALIAGAAYVKKYAREGKVR